MAELEDAPWATPDLPEAPWAKNYALSEVPMAALKNAPGSAGEFAKSLVQPVIHPIDTAVNLKNLGLGVLEKGGSYLGLTNPGEHEKYAEAVGHHFSQKYGGWENVKRSMAEDPVGVMADLSLALTGAGAAVRGGAKGAELAGLAGTADAAGAVGRGLGTAGRYADPINAAGKVGSYLANVGPEQRMLKEAGVQMTPGQLMPGAAKSVKTTEDAASSIPGLGYFIHDARGNSIKSFNQAVGRQALEPLKNIAQNTPISTGGGTITRGYFRPPEHYDIKSAAGHDMIREVEGKLGEAYDNLLPRIRLVPDRAFTNDIQNIFGTVRSSASHSDAASFERMIFDRIHGPDPVPGRRVKEVESQLTNLARKYSGSTDGSQRVMGEQLYNVVRAIRANIERVNPAHRAELQAINHGWAQYARMRDAAQKRVGSEGVFSPTDLLRAIRSGDNTVQHGSFAKGDALMQKFAEAGQKVLPSTVPDSGTAIRRAVQHAFTGSALGAGASHFLSPHIVAGLGAAAVPYTAPGMWAANKIARMNPAYPKAALQGSYRAGQNDQVQNPYAP